MFLISDPEAHGIKPLMINKVMPYSDSAFPFPAQTVALTISQAYSLLR